jgi:hypothetical protein
MIKNGHKFGLLLGLAGSLIIFHYFSTNSQNSSKYSNMKPLSSLTDINSSDSNTSSTSASLNSSIYSISNVNSSYDPKFEMEKRKRAFDSYCKDRRKGIMSPSFLTGYISRWGKSIGDVTFWSCFTPKAASSSFSVAVLVATGFIKPEEAKGESAKDRKLSAEDLELKWDKGRNHCPRTDYSCLHLFSDLPQRYRYMDQNRLESNDRFTSITFVREPMSRLVSAWKNKIANFNLQFYYQKAGRNILKRKYGKNEPIPLQGTDAAAKGMTIDFKDFIEFIASGQYRLDEHWYPIVSLCQACQANFQFIGHSEHFQQDLEILASELNVSMEIFPDDYKSVNKHANNEKKDLYEYYKDVPIEHLKKIKKYYSDDYIAFGYEMPQWLQKI